MELVGTMQRQIRMWHREYCEGKKGETIYTGKCAMICHSPSDNLICTF